MLTSKEIDELLGEGSKWAIWKERLSRRLNNVVWMMILYCVFMGACAIGWKMFWVALTSFAIVELIIAIAKHIYYGIKINRKIRKK